MSHLVCCFWWSLPFVADQTPADAPPEATPTPLAQETDCPESVESEVHFASNQSTLDADARETLGELVPCLSTGRFQVRGHADSSGGDTINDPLSEARARAVVDSLVAQGVDVERLVERSFGDSRPTDENDSAEGRSHNRRVVIREQ